MIGFTTKKNFNYSLTKRFFSKMVETTEKVYKVPNITVDAIVTRSKLDILLNKQMAEQLKVFVAQDNKDYDAFT